MHKNFDLITFLKFGLVGFLGVGVSFVLYYALPKYANLSDFVAYPIAQEAGILITFFPMDRWVFRARKYKHGFAGRLLMYHGTLISGLVVQTVILAVLQYYGIYRMYAYAAGAGAAALWNFVLSSTVVFAGGVDVENSRVWRWCAGKCFRRDTFKK